MPGLLDRFLCGEMFWSSSLEIILFSNFIFYVKVQKDCVKR